MRSLILTHQGIIKVVGRVNKWDAMRKVILAETAERHEAKYFLPESQHLAVGHVISQDK